MWVHGAYIYKYLLCGRSIYNVENEVNNFYGTSNSVDGDNEHCFGL